VKLTLNVRLWPGARVCGRLRPLAVKADDDIAALEMFKLALPLFVTV
jgi:hypothetical protein